MKADINEHITFPGKLAPGTIDGQVTLSVTITGSQEPIAGDPGAWEEAEEEGEAMLRVLVEETGDCLGRRMLVCSACRPHFNLIQLNPPTLLPPSPTAFPSCSPHHQDVCPLASPRCSPTCAAR
jgi:hypothetical protein